MMTLRRALLGSARWLRARSPWVSLVPIAVVLGGLLWSRRPLGRRPRLRWRTTLPGGWSGSWKNGWPSQASGSSAWSAGSGLAAVLPSPAVATLERSALSDALAEPRPAKQDWLAIGRWVSIALGLAAAVRAVVLFSTPRPWSLPDHPVLWLEVAVALFGGATFVASTPSWLPAPAKLPPSVRERVLAAALLTGGLTIAAYVVHLAPTVVLVAGWLGAQALFLGAVLPRPQLPAPPSRRGWLELAGAGVVLLGAAWLRLHDNGTFPLALHGDMASYGLEARKLLDGGYPDFFGFGWAAIPLIAYWPTALSMLAFGDSIVGLNSAAGIEGVATLIALYLLVRELWGWRPALFALILGAGDLYLLHYSRSAQYIDPVVFTVWALFFLVRGLRRGQAWTFAAAGLAAGYATLMYYSGRMVVPLALAAVVISALAAPRAIWSRRQGLLLAGLGFALALGPSLVSWASSPGLVAERTNQVWVLGNPPAIEHLTRKYGIAPNDVAGLIWTQAERSLLAFWRYPDAATQFGMERPMLGQIGGVLLILGLGCVVWRLRRPAELMLLAWLGGYVVSNALTIDPPASMRTVGMALPVAALGGLAIDRALSAVAGPPRWATLALAFGLAVALGASAENWQDYLKWGTDPRSETPRVQVSRYLLAQPPDYQVVTVSRIFWWHDREFEFLLPKWRGSSLEPDAVARGSVAWPSEPTVFILDSETASLLPKLQERYPGGRVAGGTESPCTAKFTAYYSQ